MGFLSTLFSRVTIESMILSFYKDRIYAILIWENTGQTEYRIVAYFTQCFPIRVREVMLKIFRKILYS